MAVTKDDIWPFLVNITGGKRNTRGRKGPDKADQTVFAAITIAVSDGNHICWINHAAGRNVHFQSETVEVADGRRSPAVVTVAEARGVRINVEWEGIAKTRRACRPREFKPPRRAAEDNGVA